jgi:hypothetical protein
MNHTRVSGKRSEQAEETEKGNSSGKRREYMHPTTPLLEPLLFHYAWRQAQSL